MPLINRFAILALLISGTSFSAEKMPPSVSRYLKAQGPVIESQAFHATSPKEQIVVRYCVDENLKGGKNEGASNPANVHCKIALFNKNRSWAFANRVFLGRDKVHEFKDGTVTGEKITYTEEDPLCCPTRKSSVVFTTTGGRLVRAPQKAMALTSR
jgi:hypothetical protein